MKEVFSDDFLLTITYGGQPKAGTIKSRTVKVKDSEIELCIISEWLYHFLVEKGINFFPFFLEALKIGNNADLKIAEFQALIEPYVRRTRERMGLPPPSKLADGSGCSQNNEQRDADTLVWIFYWFVCIFNFLISIQTIMERIFPCFSTLNIDFKKIALFYFRLIFTLQNLRNLTGRRHIPSPNYYGQHLLLILFLLLITWRCVVSLISFVNFLYDFLLSCIIH